MWHRLNLRTQILAILASLLAVTLGAGAVSIWHARMLEASFARVMTEELPAFQAAQELERALVMQKGYVTYFFQDRNTEWLKLLRESDAEFKRRLETCLRYAATDEARRILAAIDAKYGRYARERNRVIEAYRSGETVEGYRLHQEIRPQFYDIIELSEQFRAVHEKNVKQAREDNLGKIRRFNRLAVIALCIVIALGSLLAYMLVRQVLGPIRRLAMSSDGQVPPPDEENEIKALASRFQDLLSDVDQTRSKLEWSREHLVQAEKWAMTGKLAAGVAHTIRNPLTSVKMRLFSLERHLSLAPDEAEDLRVISDEITHIDGIVNNFLEFSRPPKLKMSLVSLSDAVDNAVTLLGHRLKAYDVTVEVVRDGRLPETSADLDQIKVALVNLMINACEAMVDGGVLRIREEIVAEGNRPAVSIRVSDTGPGVSEDLRDKLFEPFFSTKEEGTGLGLSIARRIVEDHGGVLDLDRDSETTCFVLIVPREGDKEWAESS